MLTKLLATWTFRQKLIVITVVLVGSSLGYVIFRYGPRSARIEQMNREAERTLARADKAKRSEDGGPTPAQLQRQLARHDKELAVLRSKLAASKIFASLHEAGAVQKLNVQLAQLAQETGVRIRERVPEKPKRGRASAHAESSEVLEDESGPDGNRAPEVSAPFVDKGLLHDICPDPLQRFVVEASFANLRDFFAGLNHLPWRVTVVDFQIEVVRTDGGEFERQPLSATFFLAL